MSCVAVPKLDLSGLPSFILPFLPDIEVPLPGLDVNLCCRFQHELPPLVIPIGSALNTLMAGAGGESIETTLALIQHWVDAVNTALEELAFDCPL